MTGPLSVIYQRESGEVPVDWKLAKVIPIYEKDMRKTQEITDLLVQPQFLEKLYSR